MAESGSTRNAVAVLGLETGQINLPRVVTRLTGVGANPTSIAHRPPWTNPTQNDPNSPGQPGGCLIGGINFWQYVTTPVGIFPLLDGSFDTAFTLYVCARGAGQITAINFANGAVPIVNGRVPISGVRSVASQVSQ